MRFLDLPITAFAGLIITFSPSPAFAHASDRGHVLLLPTGHYIAGGALAVAASFLVLALVPAGRLERFFHRGVPLGSIGDAWRFPLSLVSFAILAVLVTAGFLGSRDPLSNPLPLTVWTLLWGWLVLVQGLLGDAWRWLDPWYAPWRIVSALFGRAKDAPPFTLPARVGLWPAAILFLAFAWFELVYPAPDDPARLAVAVGLYWLASFAAMLVFGHEDWSRRGEFLSVFFFQISRFGVVSAEPEDARWRLRLVPPAAKLAATKPLPVSGVVFLLAALASVSFDGLSKTFFWLGANGVNPLEYPGRSALVGLSTFGLLLAAALLASAFLLCVLLGERMAGSRTRLAEAAGLLVWSIVPIALAYHLAHYLASLLVGGQYALVALSDPFSRGWNLFGTADMAVEAGIVAGSDAAWMLWNVQAAAIVGGHVMAVLAAHMLAARLHGTGRAAAVSQLPLTLLMIGYTVLGLWLLSTPTAG